MRYFRNLAEGIWKNNPVLVTGIGLCPALAASTSVISAFWMTFALLSAVVMTNIIVSLTRNIIPFKVRIITASVTIIEMALMAYLPDVHKSLGIYLPLIALSCLVFGRADIFASKNRAVDSALDGIGTGAGFGLVIVLLAFFREFLGANTLLGYELIQGMEPSSLIIASPGAFFILGLILWAAKAAISVKRS
jgi:electron transport complex protein RnfE